MENVARAQLTNTSAWDPQVLLIPGIWW